jgi:hypothetical protein
MMQGTLGWLRLIVFHKYQKSITVASNDICSLKEPFKGCVYIGLKVGNKRIGLMTVHLPSSPDKPQKRDECLNKLVHKYTRNDKPDIIIIGGDMNYRTNNIKEIKNDDVIEMIKNYKCMDNKKTNIIDNMKNELNEKFEDQMNLANIRVDGYKFMEPDINFCPTCRYLEKNDKQKETDEHNNQKEQEEYKRIYDPKRYPSWCDRIIVGKKDDTSAKYKIKSYESHDISNYTDHKAVSAIVTIE